MEFNVWNFRRLLLRSVIVLAALLLVVGGVVWYLSTLLVMPDRRPLQDYHYEWLDDGPGHGMIIERFALTDGSPYLAVWPNPVSGPAERGEILRRQVAEMGFDPGEYGEPRGILVLLHGRSGRKEDMLPIAERFIAAGFVCLLPDLPAHGDHPAQNGRYAVPEDEALLTRRVLQHLRDRRPTLAYLPAGLWGISMGGAYATRSAQASPGTWQALVILCSFENLEEVARRQVGWAGPLEDPLVAAVTRLAVARGGARMTEVRPGDWADGITIPTLIAHGDEDDLIPLSQGQALYESFSSARNRQWILVPGAHHGNILITEMPLYATMTTWYLEAFGEERSRRVPDR